MKTRFNYRESLTEEEKEFVNISLELWKIVRVIVIWWCWWHKFWSSGLLWNWYFLRKCASSLVDFGQLNLVFRQHNGTSREEIGRVRSSTVVLWSLTWRFQLPLQIGTVVFNSIPSKYSRLGAGRSGISLGQIGRACNQPPQFRTGLAYLLHLRLT